MSRGEFSLLVIINDLIYPGMYWSRKKSMLEICLSYTSLINNFEENTIRYLLSLNSERLELCRTFSEYRKKLMSKFMLEFIEVSKETKKCVFMYEY